jgi:hypothetical protein
LLSTPFFFRKRSASAHLVVALVVLLAALCTSPAGAQVSTSLGGDLSGRPSSATVTKIRNRAVSTAAPATGDVYKWDGSAWAPAEDETGGGGGGFRQNPLCLWTLNVTATGFCGTSNVTIGSFTVPASRWENGDNVSGQFTFSFNATVTTTVNPVVYVHPPGVVISTTAFTNSTSLTINRFRFSLARFDVAADPDNPMLVGTLVNRQTITPGTFSTVASGLFEAPGNHFLAAPPNGSDFTVDLVISASTDNPGNFFYSYFSQSWSFVAEP